MARESKLIYKNGIPYKVTLEVNKIDDNEMVTLYHGSDLGNLNVILPRSYNAGTNNLDYKNRFRVSSFWFKNKEFAMMFAVNSIIRYHADKDIVLNTIVDENMKVACNKKYYDYIKKLVYKTDGFVYEAEVSAYDIEYGHTMNFPEYTVDHRVVPKKVYKLTAQEKLRQLRFVSAQEFDKIALSYSNGSIKYGENDPIRLAVNKAIYFDNLGITNKYIDSRLQFTNYE